MKRSGLVSSEEIAEREIRDPAVRAELERTAVAEQVAVVVTTYRSELGLTQTQLARLVGMHQSAIARLEAGTHEPSLSTLMRLSTALGIHLNLNIAPDAVVVRSA